MRVGSDQPLLTPAMTDLLDKIRRAERAPFHTQTVSDVHGAALSLAFSSRTP